MPILCSSLAWKAAKRSQNLVCVQQMQQNKRQQTGVVVPLDTWSRLPASLLAHASSWIGEARALVSLESACKSWKTAANAKLNSAWKALYLHEFEAMSA